MKSYITVFSGAAICILVEAMLAMVIYAALRVLTEIDVSALWVGSCILAGCLFISAVLAALVGVIPKNENE